ncbi:hypothetical protein BaRGS_00011550, partial [Batillaria attramentaria]
LAFIHFSAVLQGHTVFDLADKDLLKVLEELKKKQVTLRTASESNSEIIHTGSHGTKRRSSVTRMSRDDKQNVIAKDSEEERVTLSVHKDDEDIKPPVTTPSIQDSETERKNELNKQTSLISPDTSKPSARDLVSRSISVPARLPTEQDRIAGRRQLASTGTAEIPSTNSNASSSDTSTDSRSENRFSWSAGQSSYRPYRNYLSSSSSYVPYYKRQHEQNLRREEEKERESRTDNRIVRPASFEPPKRDEETETQRKARAKHARQTRRSTQGVSLEDIEKAEEVLRQGDTSKTPSKESEDSASSRTSIRDSQKDSSTGETTRTSFRRPREDKDSANGTSLDITSSYVPRSQRNALSTSDINSSSLGSSSTGLSRSTSLRSKLRNAPSTEKEGEKKELSAIRARRLRRERRSTGIKPGETEGEDEKGKENKPEDEKNDSENTSSRFGRYSSSDVPSDSSSRRPGSYSEYSRSTSALDTDYKRLYEEEKEENGRLRKELDQCKKELLEAKAELDKIMRRNESTRNSDSTDKREKRALERKVSEYEEELKQLEKIKAENKKLKEENRALSRVVSKLSK